jgi:hypothetical protein
METPGKLKPNPILAPWLKLFFPSSTQEHMPGARWKPLACVSALKTAKITLDGRQNALSSKASNRSEQDNVASRMHPKRSQ